MVIATISYDSFDSYPEISKADGFPDYPIIEPLPPVEEEEYEIPDIAFSSGEEEDIPIVPFLCEIEEDISNVSCFSE